MTDLQITLMFLVMRCSLYELQQFFIVNLQYRNTSYNVNSVKIRTVVFYLLCILYNTNDPSNTIYDIIVVLCFQQCSSESPGVYLLRVGGITEGLEDTGKCCEF